jgi:hypothetical protein
LGRQPRRHARGNMWSSDQVNLVYSADLRSALTLRRRAIEIYCLTGELVHLEITPRAGRWRSMLHIQMFVRDAAACEHPVQFEVRQAIPVRQGHRVSIYCFILLGDDRRWSCALYNHSTNQSCTFPSEMRGLLRRLQPPGWSWWALVAASLSLHLPLFLIHTLWGWFWRYRNGTNLERGFAVATRVSNIQLQDPGRVHQFIIE